MTKKYSNTLLSRIGATGFNNFGSRMVVTDYENCNNILVKFIETNNTVHTNWSNFCKGIVRNVYDRTVHDIGYLGEGEYKSRDKNGNHTSQYKTWSRMLNRCYNDNIHKRQPTYKGCIVADEWHNFQNFAKWYDENYYEVDDERMELDKDILIKGNKIYSPETCVFVPKRINGLFTKCNLKRGNLPIGVNLRKDISNHTYQANCSNAEGKLINIGTFDSFEEAFNSYKKYKENLIKQIAEDYKEKLPKKLYNTMMSYEVEITD